MFEPPDILRSLLPLPKNDDQEIIIDKTQPSKILVGMKEIEIGNPHEQSHGFIKPKPIKPPDECVDKDMIYMPPSSKGLQLWDYVEMDR